MFKTYLVSVVAFALCSLGSTLLGQEEDNPFAAATKPAELIKEKIDAGQKLTWQLGNPPETNSVQELTAAIRHSIKLLESGRGIEFAQRYFEPESFAIAAAKMKLTPEQFFNRSLPNLASHSCVHRLRSYNNVDPVLLLDGRVAMFSNKSESQFGSCWVLANGKWKIRWNVPE